MKKLLIGLAAALALGGTATAVEAHTRHDRVKFVCDADGCVVKATAHGHHHHGRKGRRTKIRFTGDVCRYKPWKNVTVCRY